MSATGTFAYPGFDRNRLSHAYIVSGKTAETLAMAAVCSGSGEKPCMDCAHCKKSSRGIHPDISVIDKTENKREIIIDQIRGLKRDVIVVPNEAEKKVYIINHAESMNTNAQNAFLRILEEPPSHAVFILRTDTPAKLLPTVRSRCVELKSRNGETSPDDAINDIADGFFSALRRGNASLVEYMFKLEKLEKEQFAGFIAAARERAVTGLRETLSDGGTELRKTLFRAEQILDKAGEFLEFNVSVGHISGMICAYMINGG